MTSQKIDQLVEESMEKFNVVGAAVGIVKDGAVIHAKGYGATSIETKQKVNEHTNFTIASNTKAFTTAALAILVDEGRLAWNDRVREYIPEFKMYNTYVTENFNIQDLLTHRSGLGLGAADLMIWPGGTNTTIGELLSVFQHFEPVSAFRTQFDYDNILYYVAGEVIARVSGMSWEEFVRTRIMEPLQMDNSYTSMTQITDMSNVATPHSTETGPLKTVAHYVRDPKKINGAPGAILSNVDDLCRWMLVHLNKGKYGGNLEKQLFSEASRKEMWRIHTPMEADSDPRYNSHFAGYGLGWNLTDVRGNMLVSHTGSLPGMLSKTILIPDLNLGIIVLTNTSDGGSYVCSSVTRTIMDHYLGLDDYGWLDRYYNRYRESHARADSVSARVWETVRAAQGVRINTENYIGVYEDKWFGKVEVFINDGRLWFRCYRSPKLNGRMYYYQANTFVIRWEYQDLNGDAFAIVAVDDRGKAKSIRMQGISPDIDFSFDFQDLHLLRIETE
ncbi:serine hydrolase [bacterium]|nr:serine hydrolase [bacterium]